MNNKRIKDIILLAALPALLTACSSDRDEAPEPGPREAGQEIRFSVGVWQEAQGQAQTRGSKVDNLSGLTAGAIAVSAVFQSNDGPVVYLDRNKLTSVDEGVTWNTDGKQYWPPQTLSFYARHPHTDANISDEVVYTGFGYTIPKDNSGQHDLMYAVTRDVTESNAKASENGIVLNMKHALAAISFKAKKESSTMGVTVQGIDLCNVPTKGTFTYPETSTAKDADRHANCWTNIGVPDGGNATLSAGITETSLTTEAASVTTAGTALMLIPQTLTAWNPGTAYSPQAIPSTTDGSGCYLCIHCKVLSNSHYFAGTADSYGTVYVPFSGQFDAGRHYEITLTFGLGYGSDGKTNRVEVKLTTASINSWTHTTISSEAPIYPDTNS